ncbi:putative Histidine kinase [Planktothrix serta PCC 8927]|uniref:Circadian input-output histidine kinase CikA n=1 Tax=Planktothrix serta PCC 8927 TaxID=671068 RepID=A0A7Z9BSE0_9CYAN|nr:PAS domain-containing protein [Planktothrix serta]VXD20115.1 putative Histidine kinase [Planktothrix serta PCC 8927]
MTPSLSQPETNPIGEPAPSDLEEILVNSGEMGALISAYHWSQTSVGAMETWPGSLRTAVRTLLKSDCPMLLIWGQDWIQIYNDAYRCLLKPSQHPQALGQSIRVCRSILPEQRSPEIQRVFQTGQPQWHQSLRVLKDTRRYGEKDDFIIFYSPIWDETGRVAGVLATMMDGAESVISKSPQPQTETAKEPFTHRTWQRQKSQGKSTEFGAIASDVINILDSITDGFIVLDPQGHLIYINPAAARILQTSASTLKGKILWETLPLMAIPEIPIPLQQAITWEAFDQTQQIWLEIKAYPCPEGLIIYFQDITPRKHTEDGLRHSEARLRRIFECNAVGIGVWEESGQITEANDALLNLLGYSRGQLEAGDLNWQTLTPPEYQGLDQQALAEIRTSGFCQPLEKEYLHASGRRIPILISGAAFSPELENGIFFVLDLTQQRLCEAKWRLTEERLRVALKNSPITVFSQDQDLRYTWIYNCPKQKYPPDEDIIGVLETDLFNVEDAKKLTRIKGGVLKTGIGTREEVWVSQQGQGFYFDLTVEPLLNEQEQVVGVTCAAVNITERKQMELALHRSETLLQALLSSSPIGIAFLDHDLRYLHANEALAKLQGLPLSELIGRQLTEVLSEWADQITPVLRQVIETQQPLLNQPLNLETAKVNTCQYSLVNYYPVCLPNGSVLGVGMTVMDLTARKRAEQSEQILAMASSVLVSSLNSRTTLMNLAQLLVPVVADCCFFDVAGTDGSLRRLAVYHGDPSKQQQLSQCQNWVLSLNSNHPIAEVLASGQPLLLPNITPDWIETITTLPEQVEFLHTVAPTSWISMPLIARGRTLGAVTFCLTAQSPRHYTEADLSFAEELAYRAALALDNIQLYQQAQDANRIKDEFLTVLSHELRSPLNPILGWTKLLRSRIFDASTRDRALETIERNAKLQAQLIEDLLDVSRILRGKMALNVATVPLKATVEAALETVQLAAEAKNITIETVFSPHIGYVWGDDERLQQVVWNLLSNAVKFTPEGGWIQVHLESVGHHVQIQVQDNGQGINPNFLPHVFEYFRQQDSTTRRQSGGLGLGLAIVRHLCELHGGTVKVESPGEGLGTTFTVRLPVMESCCGHCATSKCTEETRVDLKALRILVVDDDEDMRDLIQVILEPLGAKLLIVSSAIEALRVWEDFQPLMLICDIGMPSMDGYMLMHKIRQRPLEAGGQIPAIALTAYTGEFNQQRALAAGFQQHLSKPIEPEDLVKAIAQLLT